MISTKYLFRSVLSIAAAAVLVFGACKAAGTEDEKDDNGGTTTPPVETTSQATVDFSAALTALGVKTSHIQSILVTAEAGGSTLATANLANTATQTVMTMASGTSRTFTVKLTMPTHHAVLSFTAAKTADLTAGVAATVSPAAFAIGRTRVIVPDCINGRFVVIDDSSGTNWRTIDLESLSGGAVYVDTGAEDSVYDAKIDSKGRIYLAGRITNPSYDYFIVRLDSFDDTAVETLETFSSVYGLALDETNGYIYYLDDIDGVSVFRASLNAADFGAQTPVQIEPPTGYDFDGQQVFGIAADSEGDLYVAVKDEYSDVHGVIRYTPGTTSSVFKAWYDMRMSAGNSSDVYSYCPYDVLVRGDYVYVTAFEYAYAAGYCGGEIIRLNRSNLSEAGRFGMSSNPIPSGPTAKEFFGPHRFLAVRNPGFTVIDEGADTGGVDYDRLVFLEDLSVTNWTNYGETGTETGQFQFFVNYDL